MPDARRDPVAAALAAGATIDLAFIRDLIDVRAALDVKAAELAAERATARDLTRLRAVLRELDAEHTQNPAAASLQPGVRVAAGPTLVGVLKGATGNFSLAVDLLALFAVLAGVRVVGFVRPPVHALAVDEAPAPPCPKGGPCGRPARFRERCLGRVRGDGDC